MRVYPLPAKQCALACLALFTSLTFLQIRESGAQTSLLGPQIGELRMEGGTVVTEADVPPGYRHAVLEVFRPGPGASWEPLVAGPLTGASAAVTFTIPELGRSAMVRIKTGDDPVVPPSTYSGSEYFKVSYADGGTYISPSAEMLQTLNRIGYGPSEESYSKIQTLGTTAYIEEQLSPETIDESGNTELNERVDDLFLDYLPGSGEIILERGAPIRYFKGLSEPPATWTAIGFNDAGWLPGTSGVGYDTGGNDTYNTQLNDMRNGYSTVYVRHDFQIPDTAVIDNLLLNLVFDDAFVAYLNGTEVARFNITGTPPPFNATSGSSGGFENGDPSTFDLTSFKSLLVNGTNTLAIQLINASLGGSSDAALVPTLVNIDGAPYKAISSIKSLQHLIHLRGVYSEKQLQATLAAFWENHFTTDYDKVQDYIENLDEFEALPDGGVAQSRIEAATIEYEEYEFFYQNALGNFGDLLLYSATSPSMLIYLDGILTRKNAPNENYAREILELSSFGVDNRYTQEDIEELARCFTGWSVRKVLPSLRKPFPESARTPFTNGSIAVESETPILPIGAACSYFKGTSEPPANWKNKGFTAPAGWLVGTTGLGYADGDDATELTDMRQVLPGTPGYTSFYVRTLFAINPADNFDDVVVSVDYDDAYVAYLNGVEIGRSSSMGGTRGTPPPFSATASYGHSSVADGGTPDIIDLTPHAALLLPYPQTNVLAFQLHNASITNSDATLRPQVLGRTLTADSIDRADPNGVWTFWFNPAQHDLTPKTIFPGTEHEILIPASTPGAEADSVSDALDVIDAIVAHPSTAEFISIKLVNKFVSDEISLDTYHDRSAPGWLLAIVDDAIAAWNSTSPAGNIKTVMASILDPQRKVSGFWLEGAHLSKIKDPVEFINSSFRALGADIVSGNLPDRSQSIGMLLFQRDDPDGFDEVGIAWSDTLGLLERLKLSQALADNNSFARGNWDVDAFITKFTILTPEDLIDQLDAVVFNNSLGTVRRSVMLDFANTDDSGAPDPFSGLSASQQANRLRDLAGLILSSPEFQFQ